MSQRISVYPKEGIKVRTEDGKRHIKPEGERVADTAYIRKRLREGDLLKGETLTVDPEPEAEPKPEALPEHKSTKAGKSKSSDSA